MKKLLSLVVVAGMAAFIACGPSAEEKAKAEALKDSLIKDSIAKVDAVKLDSINRAAAEKIKADSLKLADSLAKAPKKGKK